MSSLAATLAEVAKTRRRPAVQCSIGSLLGKLDDLDRKALTNAMGSDMTGEQIAAALRSEGHHMQGGTVQRHRTKRCSCDLS